MKKNGDSRTIKLERPATTTHHRHRPLIDPMVLMILILPILVLLFLFFLSYVPKSIKPTSFKSTFNLFYLFIVLLASLFSVLNHEDNESPTNTMVGSYQDQDDIGVNDESHFYDAVNSSSGSTSSKTSKLPPPRPPQQPKDQHDDRNSPSSSTAQSSWTPKPQPEPEPEPEPEPRHFDRQSSITSMSSSSESSYIAKPPPPPPFDIPPEMIHKYYGDYFVWLRSFNSNTSSSPEIQPMGQPSTSMDGGDSFSSSYDVNAKADIFISKGKDEWKMEQENKVKKKKGGPSSVNKPKINEK